MNYSKKISRINSRSSRSAIESMLSLLDGSKMPKGTTRHYLEEEKEWAKTPVGTQK